jgi:hypothetical protein
MSQRNSEMNTAIEMTSPSTPAQVADNPGQRNAPLADESKHEESEWGILQHLTPRSVIAGALF